MYSWSCVLSCHWCLKQNLQFGASALQITSSSAWCFFRDIFCIILSKLMTSVLILIWRVYRHSCRAETTFSFGLASIFLPAWPSRGGGAVWSRVLRCSILKTALLYVYNRSKCFSLNIHKGFAYTNLHYPSPVSHLIKIQYCCSHSIIISHHYMT